MYRMRLLYLLLFLFIINIKCEQKAETKSKKHLPYFRRKVEEMGDADFFETTEAEDPRNIVSFLVKNVKEIFNDVDDNSKIPEGKIVASMILSNATTQTRRTESTMLIHMLATEATPNSNSSISTSTHKDNMIVFENLSLATLLDNKEEGTEMLGKKSDDILETTALYEYDKNEKRERDVDAYVSVQPYHMGNNTETDPDSSDPRRSCIMCNNVASQDCNDPKNKLIPSIMCERDDDLCYSLHTPFGIIDRGCFNVNHNLTTYVCSCNLCNYVAISEMPVKFPNKRAWIDNVIELSRTRHFRKSVFKDMSCLRCEVNTTIKSGDMLESANCLEGNIGSLPVEECDVDEVCAVKSLRADGYIWRGCIKAPLYNYWFSVCEHDLCNYDNIIPLYDFIIS